MKQCVDFMKRIPEYLHRTFWKKAGQSKDEQLKKEFRLFYTGTQAELEALVDEYRKRQISILLVFLILAVLLLLAAAMAGDRESDSITVWRNSYGEGQKEESLMLESGEAITFTVEEREYSEEELEQVFADGFTWIRENMLLENASAGEVYTDLNFMTEVPGGLTAEWLSEEPEILSSEGEVCNEDWEEGQSCMVQVQLLLSYKEQIQTQYLNFYIGTPSYTAEEKLIRKIQKTIEIEEEQTRENDHFVIPGEIAGVSLKETGTNRMYGLFLLFAALFLFSFSYGSNRMKEKGKERKKQLEEDYPLLINKLVLYLGAGINLKNSFQQIAVEYLEDLENGRMKKRYAYEELVVMLGEMQAGTGELSAYEAFGKRIGMNSYSKLLSLLIQNRQKGNDGLLKALKTEEANAFFLRIDQAKRAGEEAGTKLLFPMLCMLLIVMVIVMAPALMQFGGF